MILKAISYLALAITIAAPLLFLADSLAMGAMKATLIFSSLLWFVTAPLAFKTSEEDSL